MKKIAIIGAGLAGSEAALVCARLGFSVTLFEMRPIKMTPAHETDLPAELICSNSLKSKVMPSAHALLKEELGILKSPLLEAAHSHSLPAGSALAVDRKAFSQHILSLLEQNDRITLVRKEVDSPPDGFDCCIIAAGPLASDGLTQWLSSHFEASKLHFYDAIAPIVSADSINFDIAFHASRWEEDTADYVNCPFNKEEYDAFFEALRTADQAVARSFENARFFEACLPIEVMASRGYKALAFGPLRPVGLKDPRTGKRPWAVCQLRREKQGGESYNLVGFQTRLTIPEQIRVFRMIPGLERAEFLRYGSIHRNTYLDSPKLLSANLSFRSNDKIFLAGQICGNEGYTESIATGHLSALFAWASINNIELPPLPLESALGAMHKHVTTSQEEPFTPTNIHFGLLPAIEQQSDKKRKKELMCSRALSAMKAWKSQVDSALSSSQ